MRLTLPKQMAFAACAHASQKKLTHLKRFVSKIQTAIPRTAGVWYQLLSCTEIIIAVSRESRINSVPAANLFNLGAAKPILIPRQ